MTDITVDQLNSEAAAIAARNTPLRVLAIVVLGIISGVAFVVGRIWLYTAHSVAFAGLAVKYGYRKGAKIPTEPKKK